MFLFVLRRGSLKFIEKNYISSITFRI